MRVKLGCDGCIRKTMFCPPSIECLSLDNKPYYLDKTFALEEIERLNSIINKVIKYIKEHCIDDEFYINLSNKEKGIIDVLTILENGVDKNE